MLYKLLIVPLLLLVPFLGFSQSKPIGKFNKRVVKIGEPLEYSLSIKYPSAENIIFPDSNYSYTPFEYIDKRYFKTVSDSVNSFDSVVYILATYEIDSIQHLSIPVFLLEDGDSTKLFPVPDSVIIAPSLTQVPDSVALMVNTDFVEVTRRFNYAYFLFGVAVIVVFSIVFVLLFGKRIIRYFKIRQLRKQHMKFLLSFKQYKSAITKENYIDQFQDAYSSWKKYLKQLTGKPFTSYSTKEIAFIVKDESLKETLREIDRAIYARRFPSDSDRLISVLTSNAQQFFEEKIRIINNGSTK